MSKLQTLRKKLRAAKQRLRYYTHPITVNSSKFCNLRTICPAHREQMVMQAMEDIENLQQQIEQALTPTQGE